jgi:hypothetical protein
VLFWAVLSLLFVLAPTLREKIETAGHIASTINPLLSKDRPDKSARRSTKLRRTDIPTSGNYVHAIDQFVTANAPGVCRNYVRAGREADRPTQVAPPRGRPEPSALRGEGHPRCGATRDFPKDGCRRWGALWEQLGEQKGSRFVR